MIFFFFILKFIEMKSRFTTYNMKKTIKEESMTLFDKKKTVVFLYQN